MEGGWCIPPWVFLSRTLNHLEYDTEIFYSLLAEYETDSFEIQSSPSPLAGDPDPVQFGLVGQKPIQSDPIY